MTTRENRARRAAELDAMHDGQSVADCDGRVWTKTGPLWRSGSLAATPVGLATAGEPLRIIEKGNNQ